MTGQAQIEVDIIANDQGTRVVEDSTTRINTAFKNMKDQQRLVQREFELSNEKFVAASKVINGVGQGVSRMLSIYNSFTLSQIQLQNASKGVSDAQDAVNQALVDFGPDSEQFKKAQKNLKDQLDQQKQTQQQVTIGYGLMATGVIADTTRMVTSVIPKLNALRGSLAAVNTAGGTPGALGPNLPFGASKLGRGLRIGAGIGGAGLGIAGVLSSGALNPQATDTDKLTSIAEMAGSGALLGSIVPGIGTLAGAGIGAGIGVAANYGGDIAKSLTQIFHIYGPSAPDIAKQVASASKMSSNYGH